MPPRRLPRPTRGRRSRAGATRLIAAPTGSGKTLAAFLSAIDALVREGVDGQLEDATRVVYVSPLKALSNDIQRNLEQPLAGIRRQADEARHAGRSRSARRSAPATPQTERAAMRELAAAHPRDDAGVAVPAAHERVRAPDAVDRAHGDRRRNSRGGAGPSAVRTWRCRSSAWTRSPRQPVQRIGLSRDAEADRGRSRASLTGSAAGRRAARSSTAVTFASATSTSRHAGCRSKAVMSGRGLGDGLRPARRAHRSSITRRSCSPTRDAWWSASPRHLAERHR